MRCKQQTRQQVLRHRHYRDACSAEPQRGSVSVEGVIVFPTVIMLTFLVVQFVLWILAGNSAQAAAEVALGQARTYESSNIAGVQAGTEFLSAHQLGLTPNSTITVTRTTNTVTVTVTGSAQTLIPGFNPSVTRIVTGPIERWVSP